MNARRTRAADWRAVAEIRALQSRAAEMAAVRATHEQDAAATRHGESQAALDAAQQGWAAALAGVFDPEMARRWFADVDRRQAEESAAGTALAESDRLLEARRTDWHAAEARADVADARHLDASARAVRRRDEARLAAVEDRAARQGRPS